ncbi:CBL-interacting serine/threonine-protein kinase 21 [Haplosporangium gracile]|nr:CBL-interacting serine/threonine-protein kinase 21 [Haplosporangium gracile]
MASFQSSSAELEAKAMADIKTGGMHHDHHEHHFHDLAASSPPNLSQLLPATEGGHSRDGDALVPSYFPTTTAATSPSTPTAAPPASTKPVDHEPPKSYWDDAFYNSTPTPKPPPRLAPMPRSPPPPPLAIRTHQEQQQSTVAAGGAIPVSDRFERLAPKSKSRYASAYHAHNRSLSHSQAHSHHGNNIFTHGNGNSSFGGVMAIGGSPSLGSSSTLASTNRHHHNHSVSGGGVFSPDHLPADGASKSFSHSSTSILSHASPAAARSSFRLDSPHLCHPQGHASSHHTLSSQQSNPLLTPSSSQSNLFSNLPSPLTRTSLSSNANIFKDPPASFGSYQQQLSTSSSWASTQKARESAGDDISEMSVLLSQDQPQHQQQEADTAAAPISSSNTNSSSVPPTGSNGQQRKIYPGLKNTVGPYRLLHNIGQGSFSEVKLAVDTRTGDHVAIKVMSRAMVQSSDRLGISVRRESDLLKSIHHPNIVGFREVVETSLQMCIVLDYASGGELFEYVADKRAIASEQDIQCIFAQIVDAVDYLHQLNIVHRDLKLENVLLEPQTRAPLRPKVKLTDFGLAKVIDMDSPLLTTRCGSEDYAAPEIILGQPYDGREADIWSLGVVLYALLVGFLPFNMRPGMSRKSFLSMIAHAEFGFPGEKVLMTRASLMNPHQHHQRSSSTASNTSSTSAHPPSQQSVSTGTEPAASSGTGSTSAAVVTTLLPAATPDTPSTSDSTSDSTLAASAAIAAAAAAAKTAAAVAAATATTSMIVPKMRGVSAVSEESKDLVRWLLQTQGSDRPTARQLRDHPWVAAGRATLLGSSNTAIVGSDGGDVSATSVS